MYNLIKRIFVCLTLFAVMLPSVRVHKRLMPDESHYYKTKHTSRPHKQKHQKKPKNDDWMNEEDFWASGDSLFDMLENMQDNKDSVIFTTTEANNKEFKKLAAKFMMIDPEYT